jgi:hypothetical protein
MKLSKKMLLFGILFSVAFFLLRTKDPFYGKILMADINDLGGITYLYSTVGIIFSILAGFIIQNRWERWNNLVLAVKGEVAALKELWSWSKQCPAPVMASIHKSIQDYLSVVIQEGWEKPAGEDESGVGEMVLASLRNGVLEAHLQPHLAASVFSIFADILTYRTKRLYHMRPMPESLRHMFVFATTLVIGLALFIGVKNFWLDYLFTVSIGLLGYLIYLVVDDLDNPMKPGIWHMTLKDYQQLLRKFQHSEPDAPAASPS